MLGDISPLEVSVVKRVVEVPKDVGGGSKVSYILL